MNDIILTPDQIPVLSKTNAATFHQQVKQRIFDTGQGLFEYIETIKFFAALDKQIAGDTASKIEPDKDFLSYIRDEIVKNGEKSLYTSARGVKFECAEVATSYDFNQCNDSALEQLEADSKAAADKVKERKEFLKALPEGGLEIRVDDELVTIYRPSKSSKSSFKVTLPK